MIIQPKIRGFICTAAHPEGCFKAVSEQIEYVKAQKKVSGPKNVLIIGGSAGYGLATGIVAAFAANATVTCVAYERPAEGKRTASAGWYNLAAFEKLANQSGHQLNCINGDAFTDSIKQETIELLKSIGPVDLIIYSLAAPRRTHPQTGEVFNSVLKPIGKSYRNKTVDPMAGVVKEIEIEPANAAEIYATEMVMGGEDWALWIEQLQSHQLLAENAITLAYSYIGPELTHQIYKEGTIGNAKRHLHDTAKQLDKKLRITGGRALISINKGLVTQASSAIPVVPLYISLLYKVMKAQGTHEGCIEQMYRLFNQKLYSENGLIVDEQNFIRLDDWEMDSIVQDQVSRLWEQVNTENINEIADLKGYQADFYRLFGFGFSEIDYQAECDPNVNWTSYHTKTYNLNT